MKPRLPALAFGARLAAANTWALDPTVEFGTTDNPNGVWSYGYSLNSGNPYAFVPFDTATDTGAGQFWTLSSYSVLATPAVWKNTDQANAAHGIAPRQLSLHTGPDAASTAIFSFTAPADGSYSFNLQFFAGDSANTQGSVLLDGVGSTPFLSFASTNGSPSRSGVISMGADDTFDVAVDKVGNYRFGNTPVTHSTRAVPEPSSASMWLLGLALMPASRRRAMPRRLSGVMHQQGIVK